MYYNEKTGIDVHKEWANDGSTLNNFLEIKCVAVLPGHLDSIVVSKDYNLILDRDNPNIDYANLDSRMIRARDEYH